MTAMSKNVYFDVLDDIVDKYNDAYHRTIKMKPTEVKSNYYTNYSVNCNDKDAKFKIGDHARISEYNNWSEEVFVIIKVKNTVPWTYIISDLNGEEIDGTFYEKEFQKTNQTEFRVEKIIKRKGDKLYVK